MFVIVAVVIIMIISSTDKLSDRDEITLFLFDSVVPQFPQRKMGICGH